MPEIISPVITPFDKENKIDKEKLKIHAKNLIDKGIDALFLNGTTGLGPSLSFSEKLENLRAVYDITNKIILQVGSLNMDETLKLVKLSKDYEIIAIASYPPYYYPRIPEKQIIKYFKVLCDHSVHPVYLYNYPTATGKDIEARIIKNLDIKGVKDTNENIAHSMEYKRVKEEMKVYNGSDLLVAASLLLGLDGSVASSTNYLPELLVKMKNSIIEGKINEALKLQKILSEIIETSRSFGNLSANYVLCEYFQGYNLGKPRAPIFELEDDEKNALLNNLKKMKEELIEMKIMKE